MPTSRLPTSRELLTSLVGSLSAMPPEERQSAGDFDRIKEQITRTTSGIRAPLQSVASPAVALLPASARPYLLTLHLLFPTLLLPALDLLDRRCVSRLVVGCNTHGATTGGGSTGDGKPDVMLQPEAQKRQKRRQEHAIYTVRSSSTASGAAGKFRHLGKGRGGAGTVADADDGDGGGGGERLWSDVSRRFYVVHVAAWNCSCAAFAFAAFPASGATGGAGAGEDRTRTAHEDNRGRVGGASRQSLAGFGGLSATSDSPPPCCKHLLACVLAERWHDVLGDFVAEKTVGPEEAAGWVAGE